MESLALPYLAVIFVAAAAVIWRAGLRLTDSTDALDKRVGLSGASGGFLLLAVAASLPEIAITISAAVQGHVGLAAGNLLGGVAIHAVVLVWMDVMGSKSDPPLTSRTRTLTPALQGLLVIGVLTVVLMGSQLPPTTVVHVEPTAVLVLVVWVLGVIMIQRVGKSKMWVPEDGEEGESASDEYDPDRSTTRIVAIFAIAALLTLAAGVVLEQASSAISSRLDIEGVVFGATILRIAGALPELSTGTQAVRRGEHQLAISDILGVSAVFVTLFLLASAISGQAIIADFGPSSVYLAAFGLLLTLIYVVGLLVRSDRTVLRMGLDSLAVLIVYILGIAGLVLVV